MPGLYHGNDFDLQVQFTGIVERNRIFDSGNVKRGDVLIGLPSSGLHTNGYSLVRKIFDNNKKLNKNIPGTKLKLSNELLKSSQILS
ncbi:MAG: AIR synthase-related protein [Ignavibacteria bacterium]